MERVRDIVNFRNGVVLSPDSAFILAGYEEAEEEDSAHTVIIEWRGFGNDFEIREIEWTTSAISVLDRPAGSAIVIGDEGQCVAIANNQETSQPIFDGPNSKDKRRPFRSVSNTVAGTYAVGMGGLIYRCNQNLNWTRVDRGIARKYNFEAIDGYSDDELYAVGWEGEIWHFDGKKWLRITSPTNVILTDVCCADDGFVYCCGQGGIVIKGRKDSWTVLEDLELEEDLWSVINYSKKVYLSSVHGIYTLEDDGLAPVMVDEKDRTFYKLDSFDNYLLSVGKKDVMLFDGKLWKEVF